MKKSLISLGFMALLAGCGQPSYVQKASPAAEFKDFKQESAAVVGVGEPISKRQMRANATLTVKGSLTLEEMMKRVATTYNLAVRWGSGVNSGIARELLISELTFDEARAYIEDVYKVQIVREGERRLLVLPAADEPRIEEFSPGTNVSLSDVIRGLSSQCDINVVITENKSVLSNTYITTSLKNVTCADAFEAVLGPHGLSLQDEGQFFTISGLPQRQWVLDLYEPVRSEEQRISYTTNIESDGSGSNSGSGANAQTANPSGGSTLSLVREERNLWSDLEQDLNTLIQRSCTELRSARTEGRAAQLSAVVGGAPGLPTPSANRTPTAAAAGDVDCGYVRINRAVGMIQMRATRSVLAQADQIVKKTEDIASRRLLVEARVLAVTRTRGFDQGSDISAGNGDASFGFTPQTQRLRSNRSIAGDLATILTNNVDGAGGFLSAAGSNLDAVVRLVENFGTTYQLLQPTLEVMDRQRATIIDGRNERYFIRDSELVTSDSGAPIINSSVEERNQFVGLQFSVTAQVAEGADDLHTLLLQLPITEITGFKELTQQIGNDSGGDPITTVDQIPIATTRVLDQKVRIRDGEIKVIGGLNRTMAVDRESGIPLIRGVPVAGKLFNEENITFEDVEFIVLMQVRRLD